MAAILKVTPKVDSTLTAALIKKTATLQTQETWE